VVEAGQVRTGRPVGGGNDLKWSIRPIFARPDLVIGKKSLRN